MAKERKLYAILEISGREWKSELNPADIKEIYHQGAGTEMCTDSITIEFMNGTYMDVDKIISE